MEYEADQRQYDDDSREYERDRQRDRSRSPQRSPRGDEEMTNGRDRDDDRVPPEPRGSEEEGARNTGSNLFVTGIHPSLSEEDVTRLFEKYGEVEKCNIMRDPHTRESRGFGFVKMVTSDQADAAKEGLQGEVHQGRTLSIEKARRSRPRTPTPGKYFGPPKREFRGGRGGGGRFGGDRYDDRRGGYSRRDDYGARSRYGGDRYEDRSYGGGRRDDYRSRDIDRYASRDDRYGAPREERRGGYRDERAQTGASSSGGGGGGGGHYGYEDRDDRYARR